MDFDLSDDQRAIKDSVDRLVRERYTFDARKRHRAEEKGWSDAVWAEFAELGILAVPFSEDEGGLGGGAVETMIVMEAFGRGLVVEPYLSAIVMAGGLLRHAGSPEQKAEWIPSLADGSKRLAFAYAERQSRYETHVVGTRASRDGDGWILSGEKSLVLHGDTADGFLVSARTAGASDEEAGIGLFLVPADAPGVSRRAYPTQDGMRAAEISFESVRVGPEAVLGDPEGAHPHIARVVDETIAALSAEAVGAMERMHALTIDYMKTRQQFGVPIGSFQVLQHRGADMFIALEQARSMMLYATMNAAEDDSALRREAISAAKVQIGRSLRFIGQNTIQLHGGVGVTMEYEVGHLFKRTAMIDLSFGDADWHLEKLAEQGGMRAL
ncbi:MAG: acyl-CoA dehydrogenase family protein [Rhizobiaceae bacterium]|nr:acyl-CoA dehydrogenase family protein [Rhizobiaceae bacterium]